MVLSRDMKIGVFCREGSRWEIGWWQKKQKQWKRLKWTHNAKILNSTSTSLPKSTSSPEHGIP